MLLWRPELPRAAPLAPMCICGSARGWNNGLAPMCIVGVLVGGTTMCIVGVLVGGTTMCIVGVLVGGITAVLSSCVLQHVCTPRQHVCPPNSV
jgi:hypothetical protein